MSPTTRHGSALMLTALLFAPSFAAEAAADADVRLEWEDIALPDPPAEAPAQPPRPDVSITAGEMARLTGDEYRTYNGLCKGHIDRTGHWDHAKARWYTKEGVSTVYYDSCARREDIARRMQRQQHEGGNPRLPWEYAMQMAGDVHDILKSYHDELQHQKDLEHCHHACNCSSWVLLGTLEIWRARMDNEWWGKVHPHIVTRRCALVGDHAFRNALEVFLQLRSEGRDLADIKAKYPEVYTALNAVIDPTERQMNELRNYDRLTTNGQ